MKRRYSEIENNEEPEISESLEDTEDSDFSEEIIGPEETETETGESECSEEQVYNDDRDLFKNELTRVYDYIDTEKYGNDKSLKEGYDYNKLSKELGNIFNEIKKEEEISIMDIITSKLDNSIKKDLIEKFIYMHQGQDEEYYAWHDYIKMRLYNKEQTTDVSSKISESKMSESNKKTVLGKYIKLKNMDKNSGEFNKLNDWLTKVMNIPFGEYKDINIETTKEDYLGYVRKTLDENILHMEDAKDEIINYIASMLNSENNAGRVLSLYGEKGCGKTSLIKNGIAKVLNRPFHYVSLGGCKDSSFLKGHGYTYEGALPGRIAQILIESKCMNPIIYLDELDKVSEAHGGKDIMSVLTHILDPVQNMLYTDYYFDGITMDLSKVLFICSYNNQELCDDILMDRIKKIHVKTPNTQEKMDISRDILIKNITEENNIKKSVYISDENLKYIINKTKEPGCRELKRMLEDIIIRLNNMSITSGVVLKNYRNIKPEKYITETLILDRDVIDIILDKDDNEQSFSMMYI